MSDAPTPPRTTPRRSFLRALALVPAAAAAGCATSRAAGEAGKEPAAPPAAAAPDAEEALRAIRAVPLALDAEPAFVFRALAARPRE